MRRSRQARLPVDCLTGTRDRPKSHPTRTTRKRRTVWPNQRSRCRPTRARPFQPFALGLLNLAAASRICQPYEAPVRVFPGGGLRVLGGLIQELAGFAGARAAWRTKRSGSARRRRPGRRRVAGGRRRRVRGEGRPVRRPMPEVGGRGCTRRECLAMRPGGFDQAEAGRGTGAGIPGFELRLRERIVITVTWGREWD